MGAEPLSSDNVLPMGRGSMPSRMQRAERDIAMLKTQMTNVEANTSQILGLMTGAKSAAGFVRRWAPKVAAAFIGAGVFNPKVNAFLSHLF